MQPPSFPISFPIYFAHRLMVLYSHFSRIFYYFCNMNVQGFMAAMLAYDHWVATHPNASSDAKNEAYDIAQGKAFENWIYDNPNGSLEQYLSYIHQRQAYYNSPQYQLETLEHQISTQSKTIEYLRDEIEHLKRELRDTRSDNENLSHYNTVWCASTISLLLFVIVSSLLSTKNGRG